MTRDPGLGIWSKSSEGEERNPERIVLAGFSQAPSPFTRRCAIQRL
jgi:hypothetical protein